MSDYISPNRRGATVSVLVADGRSHRAASVAGVVQDCGADTQRLNVAGHGAREPVRDLAAAIVAIGEPTASDRATLEMIRALRDRGVPTIAYEDNATQWGLGVQARVLLAGAAGVLDSAQSSFLAELRGQLEQLLASHRGTRRDRERTLQLMRTAGVIGSSEPMVELFRVVVRVSALSDVPVLIEGETGTGKELVARAIHHLDAKRRNGPFVAVNCSAINSNVAESELFGHRRGAFTGADRDRKGLFRLADGGVLFLDEVSELDLGIQGKLLRVLQDHRVLGVGDDHEVPVDVRVIVASNRKLTALAADRTFRQDLLYRLAVVTLQVPALRDRLEDIGPLVDHFLVKHKSLGPIDGVDATPEFVNALANVELPGNVRQLENLVRQILVTRQDASPLRLRDLPTELWAQLAKCGPPASSESARQTGEQSDMDSVRVLAAHEWSLRRSLQFYERCLLQAALERARGNHSQTAGLLGITPRSIYTKLRKYGLHH